MNASNERAPTAHWGGAHRSSKGSAASRASVCRHVSVCGRWISKTDWLCFLAAADDSPLGRPGLLAKRCSHHSRELSENAFSYARLSTSRVVSRFSFGHWRCSLFSCLNLRTFALLKLTSVLPEMPISFFTVLWASCHLGLVAAQGRVFREDGDFLLTCDCSVYEFNNFMCVFQNDSGCIFTSRLAASAAAAAEQVENGGYRGASSSSSDSDWGWGQHTCAPQTVFLPTTIYIHDKTTVCFSSFLV